MNLFKLFEGFDHVILEVATAISPVLVLFVLFLVFFKLPGNTAKTLLIGITYSFVGLALFLQGVSVGFLPVGSEMGSIIGSLTNNWVIIPFGFLLGFLATLAEPAVRILCDQVERSSSGSIPSRVILLTLCFSVGLFIALGMTRIVFGIPFYYIIIPGYLLTLVLLIFSNPSFTAIAFDSGGVATGPMTVTFIMAMAVGAADRIEGRDAVIDGFGLIALVALAPIIMVMLLGLVYPRGNADGSSTESNESEGPGEKNHLEQAQRCDLANGQGGDKKSNGQQITDKQDELQAHNPEPEAADLNRETGSGEKCKHQCLGEESVKSDDEGKP